jgi:hypothetical protein
MYPFHNASTYVFIRELDRMFPSVERQRSSRSRVLAAILGGLLRTRRAARQGTEHAGSVAAAAPPDARSATGDAR